VTISFPSAFLANPTLTCTAIATDGSPTFVNIRSLGLSQFEVTTLVQNIDGFFRITSANFNWTAIGY